MLLREDAALFRTIGRDMSRRDRQQVNRIAPDILHGDVEPG